MMWGKLFLLWVGLFFGYGMFGFWYLVLLIIIVFIECLISKDIVFSIKIMFNL